MNSQTKLRLVSSGESPAPKVERGNLFRVIFEGTTFEMVRLDPIVPEKGSDLPAALRLPARSFVGVLLNVSVDGIGVKVSQFVASQLFYLVRCRCTFRLPALAAPIEVTGAVVHGRPAGDGGFCMHLRFEFTDGVERHLCMQKITQFTAWFERQQLRVRNETCN